MFAHIDMTQLTNAQISYLVEYGLRQYLSDKRYLSKYDPSHKPLSQMLEESVKAKREEGA